jgi:hypothetical protein
VKTYYESLRLRENHAGLPTGLNPMSRNLADSMGEVNLTVTISSQGTIAVRAPIVSGQSRSRSTADSET